ncbi:MAG: DUF433 domain-containing protein [Cyanobacteria bacterium P01_D01_bin.36]
MQIEDYFNFLSPDDIRIQGHRIGIDTVLEPFLDGFSPESIAADYPELGLEKIYATITYYYRRQSEVEDYLKRIRQWRENGYQEALKNPSPVAKKIRRIKAQKTIVSAS